MSGDLFRRDFLVSASSLALPIGTGKPRLEKLIDELEHECRLQYPDLKQFEVRMKQGGKIPLMIVAFS